MNSNKDNVFTLIPVEHLIMNSIDRLGDYLVISIPFLQDDYYDCAVELSEEEERLVKILKSNQEIKVLLSDLQYCSLFIRKKVEDMSVESIIFDVERSCDFLAISQYRYDRKEYSMGKPGSYGSYLKIYDINIETETIKPCYKEKHCFNEIPGLGLEVSYSFANKEDKFYPILFSNRTDEVYMLCRYYITKACRTFTIPSIQSTFLELFATLEGIGTIGCLKFIKFTEENKRIMAVNSKTQEEYEKKLDAFCYYSEVLRTLTVHQGRNLLEFMDRKSLFRLLTDIFYQIILFAKNIISTELYSLEEINAYIESKVQAFVEHISTNKDSFILLNEEKGIDGERDVFILPIENLDINKYIKLGKVLIIPVDFLSEYKEKREKCLELKEYFIDEILADDLIQLNKYVAWVLVVGKYQMEKFDNDIETWQYIDDICGEVQNMLVPLFVQNETKCLRDNCFGAVGVYNGIRIGAVYNSNSKEINEFNGRVYSLMNNTENAFYLDEKKLDDEIIDIVCSFERMDEVAIACRNVIITIGKAMREDDITYMLMDILDAVDKIYPCIINIAPKWKWIASFLMDKRSEYDKYYSYLRKIGELYRTPMYHFGKNASDLFSNEEEFHLFFNKLKGFLLKCTKRMYETKITTWEDLRLYRSRLMNPHC